MGILFKAKIVREGDEISTAPWFIPNNLSAYAPNDGMTIERRRIPTICLYEYQELEAKTAEFEQRTPMSSTSQRCWDQRQEETIDIRRGIAHAIRG
ncbi:uncharacterized protein STEHIDRAFT_122788 [Stereum hirsutum FP-91666 SS1]|uniref:uncharacterized protein n=1 Tax=Stereum hirsutum (strain FP-91666) TaxID=721885 RepID=UPI00044492D0|nr:uncharacterized protein STEHIDRAFT_122788 [Stereum hirsutum FP-91666 SS1]EIM84839.1 hypothetical protein STEHIDRAFT_122788 [Stereum hirsutum FP-91666 SS1]